MEKIRASLLTEVKNKLKLNNDTEVRENVDMSGLTSFRAGGKAALLAEVGSVESLKNALKIVSAAGVFHMILGNGSNTLFKDSGYEGVVIRLSQESFSAVEIEGEETSEVRVADKNGTDNAKASNKILVRAGAGILLSSLAKALMSHSLSGFEFAGGIPGSLGGALFMNAGAYGGEMKDIVRSVKAVAPDGSHEKLFSAEEMNFSYRHSALEENGYIAVEAEMELLAGDKEHIAEKMKELAIKRSSKQPVQYPSAGSTFKRPEGYFAGKLIEDAGLKGVAVGGAQVSVLHSGFIINKGGATATDIIRLITLVQNRVYDEFGIMLQPEVKIIG